MYEFTMAVYKYTHNDGYKWHNRTPTMNEMGIHYGHWIRAPSRRIIIKYSCLILWRWWVRGGWKNTRSSCEVRRPYRGSGGGAGQRCKYCVIGRSSYLSISRRKIGMQSNEMRDASMGRLMGVPLNYETLQITRKFGVEFLKSSTDIEINSMY